jgi:hypothetical protein
MHHFSVFKAVWRWAPVAALSSVLLACGDGNQSTTTQTSKSTQGDNQPGVSQNIIVEQAPATTVSDAAVENEPQPVQAAAETRESLQEPVEMGGIEAQAKPVDAANSAQTGDPAAIDTDQQAGVTASVADELKQKLLRQGWKEVRHEDGGSTILPSGADLPE